MFSVLKRYGWGAKAFESNCLGVVFESTAKALLQIILVSVFGFAFGMFLPSIAIIIALHSGAPMDCFVFIACNSQQ